MRMDRFLAGENRCECESQQFRKFVLGQYRAAYKHPNDPRGISALR